MVTLQQQQHGWRDSRLTSACRSQACALQLGDLIADCMRRARMPIHFNVGQHLTCRHGQETSRLQAPQEAHSLKALAIGDAFTWCATDSGINASTAHFANVYTSHPWLLDSLVWARRHHNQHHCVQGSACSAQMPVAGECVALRSNPCKFTAPLHIERIVAYSLCLVQATPSLLHRYPPPLGMKTTRRLLLS